MNNLLSVEKIWIKVYSIFNSRHLFPINLLYISVSDNWKLNSIFIQEVNSATI